eukprot:1172460-Prorocentrum_minimum.AAC.4
MKNSTTSWRARICSRSTSGRMSHIFSSCLPGADTHLLSVPYKLNPSFAFPRLCLRKDQPPTRSSASARLRVAWMYAKARQPPGFPH